MGKFRQEPGVRVLSAVEPTPKGYLSSSIFLTAVKRTPILSEPAVMREKYMPELTSRPERFAPPQAGAEETVNGVRVSRSGVDSHRTAGKGDVKGG